MEEIKKIEFVVSENKDFNYKTATQAACVNMRGGKVKDTIFIMGTSTSWCITRYEHRFYMLGKKRFVKRNKIFDVAYREYNKDGKKKSMWFGNPSLIEKNMLKLLFEMFDLDWAINFIDQGLEYASVIKRKPILAKVIKGSITSYEGVYKELQRNVFKIQKQIPSWKIMKKWIEIFPMIPDITIYDICDFTKNPMITINRIYNDRENVGGVISLYADTIRYAIKEDDIIDFKWSYKRINDYHLQQIERESIGDLSKKSRESIYQDDFKNLFEDESITVIDTEYMCALNAIRFSNCSYKNYWKRCYGGTYILFLINYKDELAMLGCYISKTGQMDFDQCFRPFNQRVSEELDSMVIEFVDKHKILPCFRIVPSNQDFESTDITPW